MKETGVEIGGAIILWKLTEWSDRASFADALRDAGFGQFSPEPRTRPACLKDALDSVYLDSHYHVARLKNQEAFEVIQVERKEWPEPNVRKLVSMARINMAGDIEFSPWNPDMDNKVLDSFNNHLGLIRAGAVGKCLVDVLGHLNATPLRPGGGVYWMAANKLDQWLPVAAATEKAGHVGSNSVYLIRNIMDVDAVRTVASALVDDVLADVDRMEHDILDRDADKPLGERALENRKVAASLLRDKINFYEDILGKPLDKLHQGVDKLELTITQAELLISAGATSAA